MSDPAARFAHTAPGVHNAETLRAGEFLHVYAARLDGREETVRLFTPAPDISETAVRTAFERVADAWYDLRAHPNVVTVLARDDTPRPWLAVEATEGVALSELGGELSLDETRSVIADAAEALREASRHGTTHTALKPAYVRAVRSEQGASARVGNWGIERACRIAAGERPISSYTPPELLDDPTVETEAIDIYGLGGVTYYAITGQPPMRPGDDLETAIRNGASQQPHNHLPYEFGNVVWQALASEPAERYQSLYEFKLAIMFDTLEPTQPANSAPQGTAPADTGPAVADSTQSPTEQPAPDEDETDDRFGSAITRRAALGVVGVSVLAGGAWAASTQLGGATSYGGVTSFRYDTANTGHAPDESGPTTDATAEWTFEAGDGVLSSPIVVDDTVYVANNDGTFFALDATDGTEQWTTGVGGPAATSPAVTDGTVYVGGNDGTTSGIYALDTADGTEQWVYEESQDGHLSPVVDDGTVYVADLEGIRALDAADGTEQWVTQDTRQISLTSAVVDDTLVAGTPEGIVALDAADGSEEWRFDTDSIVFSSPAVVDGTVYAGVNNNTLYALRADDGTERWSAQTGEDIVSSPAVVDDTVYVGSNDKALYAFDTTDGSERWSVVTGDSVVSSPAVVGAESAENATVYVGSRDNSVYAVDGSDGTVQWTFQTGDDVVSSPAVVDGMLYIGSVDGRVYALTET